MTRRSRLNRTPSVVAARALALQQDASKPLIELREVVKTYETEAGDVPALRGISVAVKRGDLVVVYGKSGAGKSTLVNMVSGVDQLTSGEVLIGGTSVHDLDESKMALWRGVNLGIIYQTFELLPQLSLLDNVTLPMDLCGLYHPKRSVARARELLRQVGLEEHTHKPPTKISGGQKQRVAIARALANDPPILVADEPTGSLDSSTAGAILGLFEGLVAAGKTVVMVTHDESLIQLASLVLRITDGQIVERRRISEPAL